MCRYGPFPFIWANGVIIIIIILYYAIHGSTPAHKHIGLVAAVGGIKGVRDVGGVA